MYVLYMNLTPQNEHSPQNSTVKGELLTVMQALVCFVVYSYRL